MTMDDQQLTIKQRKWLKAYLECGNATEAAMQSYDCKDRESAANIGWENVRKLDFSDLMEESGLTDTKLQQKLSEGLESTKPISALVLVNSETGTSKTKDNEGQIEVPDFAVRHKYLETALKLKKRLVERTDITSQGQPLAVNLVSYGSKDPIANLHDSPQLPTNPPNAGSPSGSPSLSSAQLASQSAQNDIGH